MAELAPRLPFAALALPGVAEQRVRSKLLLTGDADAFAVAVPRTANSSSELPGWGRCLWLRPDRWLLLTDRLEGSDALVKGSAAWVLDVGSRYAGVTLRGPRATQMLAAGCGLDLRLGHFAVGQCAQSRIEQVPAILLRLGADEFEVMVERPLAHYFALWLRAAAGESGT